MNIEILKRNISDVIMQPCVANYPVRIKSDGLSDDGTYIYVKVTPDDSCMKINITDGYVERIVESLPEKYRDKIVTLRHYDWVAHSYVPVFDTDTQEEWDNTYKNYIKAKQEWCDKYGCD